MKITCDKCNAKYTIDGTLLSAGAIKVQCPACGDIRLVHAPQDTGKNSSPRLPDSTAGQAEVFGVERQQMQDPFDAMKLDNLGPPSLPNTPVQGPAQLPSQEASYDSVFTNRNDMEELSLNDEVRCKRCGGLVEGVAQSDGLCSRCKGIVAQSSNASAKGSLEEQRSWRVRKPDGIILGPLSLSEVKIKFQEDEVTAADQVVFGDGEFKLISSFPEFSMFFRRSDIAQPIFRQVPPSHVLRNISLSLLVLMLVAGVGIFFFWSDVSSIWKEESPLKGVLEEVMDGFSAEIPSPSGTSAQSVKNGLELMYQDERLSYLEADRQFKGALLLDPANMDAYWAWVQNRALMDYSSSDVTQRKTALDLVDYALERSPDNSDLLRAKGYLLWSLGRVDEARVLASKVVSLNDDDADAKLLLGSTFLDSSTDMAIDLLEEVLDKKPGLPLVYRLLGEAKIKIGRFHEALAFFDKRLEKDPSQFASLEAEARIYLSVGESKKAIKIFEKILVSEPHSVKSVLALARIKFQFEKNRKAALQLLDGFVKNSGGQITAGDKAKLLAEKSVLLRLKGKFDEAEKLAKQSMNLDSIWIPARYSMAWLSLLTGDVGQAIVKFKGLRPHMPDSSRIVMLLAESQAEIPNYESAIKNYRKAIELNPNDLDVYLSYSVLQLFLDNINMSYASLRMASKVDPFYDKNHMALTPYYDGKSIWKLVLPKLEESISTRTDDPLALSLAGAVYWRCGKNDKALRFLKKALLIDEECFSANLFLGTLLMDYRKPKDALKYLARAHREDSLSVTAGVLLAYAQMQSGHAKKAVKLAKRMLKIDPGSLSARLCLAESLLARGMRKTGISMLLKICKADSSNMRAKGLLFNLGY